MVIVIKQKHLEKDKLFARLQEKEANIKKEVEEAISNKGVVFGYKKSGEIKALSIFIPEADNEKVIKHSKDLYLDDLEEKKKETFEKSVENHLSESVSYGEYDKVEWNNKNFTQKKVKIGKAEVGVGVLFIFGGVIASIILDDLIWLCIGFAIGLSAGTVVSEINKRK